MNIIFSELLTLEKLQKNITWKKRGDGLGEKTG